MIVASTRFETANGARYMAQLARHFAHKIAVQEDDAGARLTFGAFVARLRADAAGLVMTVEAEDAEGLASGQRVLVSHLERFAFREPPAGFVWTADAD